MVKAFYQDDNSAKIQPDHIYEAGDLIISYIEQLGVEYVFGIPGGAIEPFYNALARSERKGGPRSVLARHETGAAFMADGYFRETGKMGVCCATTGPGATNLITGVANAYQDNIPMLVITAQTPLHTFGKGAFQESSHCGVNIVAMFKYCTRYNGLVTHIEQLESMLVDAIMTAHQSPRGPVHLSIPCDIMKTAVANNKQPFHFNGLLRNAMLPANYLLTDFYKLLQTSNKPVLIIGSGCSDAMGTILELATLKNIPVLATPQGQGLISAYHPQFKGIYGFAGHKSAYRLLKNDCPDLVIAVGTSLSEWESSGWDEVSLLNEKLIHIDSSVKNFSRSSMARLHITGSIYKIFKRVLNMQHDALDPEGQIQRLDDPLKLRGSRASIDFERRLSSRRSKTVSFPSHNNVEQFSERRRSDRRLFPSIPNHPKRTFDLDEEDKVLDGSTPIKPQRLMLELSRKFPANTVFYADTGNSFAWVTHYLHPVNRRVAGHRDLRGGNIRVSMEFSSMGWAIGAAVGGALGNKKNIVVCVTGDGSFLMSGQELSVAIEEHLNVVFVLLNDSELGMVKHGQRLTGAERIGYSLPTIDFCSVAEAMGANAYVIKSADDFELVDFDRICHGCGPTLLDVRVDPEESPPMQVRITTMLKHKIPV